MTEEILLPALIVDWTQRLSFVALTTLMPDGSPHSALMWAAADSRCLRFTTKAGSRKHRNLQLDPRAAAVLHDPDDPYHSVSVRGTVQIQPDEHRALTDCLYRAYHQTSEPFPFDGPNDDRVVLVFSPTWTSVFRG